MGWCSGTDIFDPLVEAILNTDLSDHEKINMLCKVIDALEDADWDCQSDSAYYDNTLVHIAFVRMHPDWFKEEAKPIKPTPMPDITVSAVQLRQILDRIARLTDLIGEQTHRTDVLDKLFREDMNIKSKHNLKVAAEMAGQEALNKVVMEQIFEIKNRLTTLEKFADVLRGPIK